MPHVSRNTLDKKVEKELINTFDLILSKLSKHEDISAYLLSLLTPTERIMLAKRLAIIILIREGYKESEISLMMNVTRVTVSRLQFYTEVRGEGFEPAFKILDNEKIYKELKIMLIKLARYTAKAAGGRI